MEPGELTRTQRTEQKKNSNSHRKEKKKKNECVRAPEPGALHYQPHPVGALLRQEEQQMTAEVDVLKQTQPSGEEGVVRLRASIFD